MAQAIWELLKPPRGMSVRRAVAFVCLFLGFDYIFYIPATTVNQAYVVQRAIMPLWVWGAAMMFGAGALLFTLRQRRNLLGRAVALGAFVVFTIFAFTFAPGSPTGLTTYAVFAYMSLGELSFVGCDDDD